MQVDAKWVRSHIKDFLDIERESFEDPKNGNIFSSVYDDAAKHMHYFARMQGSELAGYLILSLVADEAEIINVAVAPRFRRCGLARALVEEAVLFAKERDAAAMYLEVRESNVSARTLYEQTGFNICGRRKNYYNHPQEDAILMSLKLEDI